MNAEQLRVNFDGICNGAQELAVHGIVLAADKDAVVGDEICLLFSGWANTKAPNASEHSTYARYKTHPLFILQPSSESANKAYQDNDKLRYYLQADNTRPFLLIGGASHFKQDEVTLSPQCCIVVRYYRSSIHFVFVTITLVLY